MTDTFLDTHQTRTLTHDLTTIASSSSELLRIARREVSPPGGRTARNPRTPGSRPPLNLGALSVADEIHTCLADWARNLRDDTHIPMPAHMDDTGLALHLRQHVHRIAQQSWAEDCADEIGTWASTILAITTSPPPRRLADYSPAERAEGMTIAKVDAAMCAELVTEWTDGILTPKPDTIRRMGKSGHITEYGPASHRAYSPREVINHMRHSRARRALDKIPKST